jgi:hypothetical protein
LPVPLLLAQQAGEVNLCARHDLNIKIKIAVQTKATAAKKIFPVLLNYIVIVDVHFCMSLFFYFVFGQWDEKRPSRESFLRMGVCS